MEATGLHSCTGKLYYLLNYLLTLCFTSYSKRMLGENPQVTYKFHNDLLISTRAAHNRSVIDHV